MIYFQLFLTFLKIGAFTFGGGYAMLPLVQSEVTSKGWLDLQSLVNFIAVSESTPGPFAVNVATFVGSQVGGFFGAFCATVGVVLPSFVIILVIAKFFVKFKDNQIVKGCMSGLKPAVIGLIASAVISVGTTVFFSDGFTLSVVTDAWFYVSLAVLVLSLVLTFKKVHPIAVICIAAILGIVSGYVIN